MTRYLISKQLTLNNDETREFTIETEQGPVDVFVIKHEEQLYAYQNRCPHLGIPLNWQPDDFLSLDTMHIQCATHGALFRPDDGYCVMGPCSGQSLSPLKIESDKNSGVWLSF